MFTKKMLSSLILFILTVSFLQLRADEEFAPQVERYSERVLIVKTGTAYFDQVIAIATNKGIIMIDTGISPSLTKKYREIIEREFGRNDFRYVINTHFHFDHTDGNQVFADATIIAHQTTPDRMREFEAGRKDFIQRRTAQNSQLEEQLKALEPNSANAQRLANLLYTGRIMVADLENDYKLTLPTLSFNDHLTLHMGDLTLKLVHFGEGRHTGDDIIIHCPEEKLLFTGDLFFRNSFIVSFRPQFDASHWIEVLNEVLADTNTTKFVYDVHNGRMTARFLCTWRDYLVDLYQKFASAKKEGLDFDTIKKRHPYENFSYIEKSGITPDQLRREHDTNLRFCYYQIYDLQSASQSFYEIITQSGITAAVDKFKELRSTKDAKYYFDETEFNQIGYRLMREGRGKEAIEIFKMNVELYPASWNVYDSLGEGYMNDGQNELAIKNYKKSIELNPQNTNGIDILKRLEGSK
ncbi:MAG TPA: MBL fold metallo-hydrolase [bacterium]